MSKTAQSSTPPQRPTIGSLLHYRYREEDGCASHAVGDHRPARVVQVWRDEYGAGEDGYNLLVYSDGKNDFPHGMPHGGHAMFWVTSVRLGDQNGQACTPPPSAAS